MNIRTALAVLVISAVSAAAATDASAADVDARKTMVPLTTADLLRLVSTTNKARALFKDARRRRRSSSSRHRRCYGRRSSRYRRRRSRYRRHRCRRRTMRRRRHRVRPPGRTLSGRPRWLAPDLAPDPTANARM